MSEGEERFCPPYSILERSGEGTDIVTTVIVDGEVMDFIASRSLRKQCRGLVTNKDEEHDVE